MHAGYKVGLACPHAGVTALRRVFNPFDWHLRHYKAAASSSNGDTPVAAGLPTGQSLASRSKSHIYGSTSGAAAGSGGDEVGNLHGTTFSGA